MPCRYCKEFVESKRRTTPSEGSDKYAPQRRLCGATKAWKNEKDETCEEFISSNSFWCDKLQQCMDIDACRNKKAKKMSRHCKRCSQYNDIKDVIRNRVRSKVPVVVEPVETPVQPTLLRRRVK